MPPEGDGGPSVSDTSVNKEPSNLSKPKGTEPSGTESPSWLERNRPLLEMMSLDATPLGFAASGVLAMMDFRKGDVVGGGLNTLGALPVVGAAATISKVGKITNHSEDAVKLAKSLGGERQAAELLGPAAADTGLPFSRIVPGGGLKAHEKASGHSWDWHIGRSESELIERFALEKMKMEASSSFYDQTTAERAIADLLDANAAEISNWLSSPKGKMTLHHTGQNPVGIYVKRGDTSAVDVNSTRAILIRNPSMPTGYHILTGFPQP
jgi:filamentous hemagglutinin